MKKFELKKVSYQNIMSVGDQITVDLSTHKKTLITGTNGASKSTLLEAITFAIFGVPFRNINKGQLVNTSVGKKLLVDLDLEYDNSMYRIIRGIKPNIFEIYKDGIKLEPPASIKDFQDQFESMISMNYASFKQIVILGTAGYTPFMELSLPNRRKLVEDLLGVSILAEMSKLNKDQLKDTQNRIILNDKDISNAQIQIKTHEDYIERQRKMSVENISKWEHQYQDCIDKVNYYKSENLKLSEKVLSIELPTDPSQELAKLSQNKAKILGEISPKQRVFNLYQTGGNCPTCLQELQNPSLKNNIEADIKKLEFDAGEYSIRLNELKELQIQYQSVKNQQTTIEQEIASNKKIAIEYIERAKKLKLVLEKSKEEVVDNTQELEQLKNQLSNFIDLKSELIDEKHRRTILVEMLKDSGIKSTIVGTYIPMINAQINKYLTLLEADYQFELKDDFSEIIKSRGREGFSYSSFSQGEKGRIDLAILFTWRDVAEKVSNTRVSSLFLDEVFDSCLDKAGTKLISKILDSMNSNVFIISHNDDHNPDDYDQHIKFKKVGRFSVIDKGV